MTELKNLKHGDFFLLRNPGDAEIVFPRPASVWVRGDYDRSERAYWCFKFEDVNSGRYIKGNRQVFTNICF